MGTCGHIDAASLRGEGKTRRRLGCNNMCQGLFMLDAEARLVVCNDLYIQTYGLRAAKFHSLLRRSSVLVACLRLMTPSFGLRH